MDEQNLGSEKSGQLNKETAVENWKKRFKFEAPSYVSRST